MCSFSSAFFLFLIVIYFLIFGCPGSSLLHTDFSLVAVRGRYSPVGVRWLLIAVASLVAEHRL